jgi:hypothetical protein
MNPIHAILIVIIRVWAAGIIVGVIVQFPSYFVLPQTANEAQSDSWKWTIAQVASYAIWLIVGTASWILAPRLARLVYPRDRDDTLQFTVSADTMVMLGSFLIGAFYIVRYFPSWITQLGAMLIEIIREDPSARDEFGSVQVIRFTLEQALRESLIIIAALWMALRPAHIAHIFSYLRRAGLHDEEGDK